MRTELQREFDGYGVIVTGGASGIGKAVCRGFVQQGATVFMGDVNEQQARSLVDELSKQFADAIRFSHCDVSKTDDVTDFISRAAQFLPQVDVLVNCAGIVSRKQPEEISPEEWDRTLGINLRGTFLMGKATAPLLRQSERASIVNFSSAGVRLGGVASGADYIASKGGIAALTLHLSKRFAPLIRVNAVSPGVIDTPMTTDAGEDVVEKYLKLIPLGRLGKPEEVADAVLFLASQRASYITGAVLEVTGGF